MIGKKIYADVAQLAEQLICNQQVIGSSPIIGLYYGWVPERPKGADCKSVVDDFEGSNPSPSIRFKHLMLEAFIYNRIYET